MRIRPFLILILLYQDTRYEQPNNLTAATGTPVVSVSDNRGLAVRVLNWNREQAADPLRLLVSHSYMDDASRVVTYRDPRLFTAWTTDSASPANLHTMPSLAGQLLKRESSDSGELVTLFDAAGRPEWTHDGRGTVQTVAYDELGRPESGSELMTFASAGSAATATPVRRMMAPRVKTCAA